jgi:hypothetical protein
MSRAKIVETRCDAGPVFSCVGCFTRHAHLMTNPKYNRLSLALALILNVLMVAGTPARAWSYRDRCAAASGNRNAARAICPMLGKPGPCCCASASSRCGGRAPVGRTIGMLHRCGCALGAPPPTPPAAAVSIRWGLSLDDVPMLPVPTSPDVELEALGCQLGISTGPPRSAYSPASPPRAPPTR